MDGSLGPSITSALAACWCEWGDYAYECAKRRGAPIRRYRSMSPEIALHDAKDDEEIRKWNREVEERLKANMGVD
jgi:hypothetical protein